MVGRNSLRKSTRRKMSRRGRSRMSKRAQKGGGEKPGSLWLVEKMTSGYKDASMEEYVRGLSQPRYLYNIIAKEAASKAVAGDETTTKTLMSGGSYIYEMYIYDKELLQYHYLWFSYTGLSDLNKRMKERAWPQRKDITKIYKAATTYQRAGVIVQTLDNYLTAPEMGGTTIDGLFGTNDGIAWKERDIYHLNLTSSDSAPQTEPQALHGEVSASLEPHVPHQEAQTKEGVPKSRARIEMEKTGRRFNEITEYVIKELYKIEKLPEGEEGTFLAGQENLLQWVVSRRDEINGLLNWAMTNNVLLELREAASPLGRVSYLPQRMLCRLVTERKDVALSGHFEADDSADITIRFTSENDHESRTSETKWFNLKVTELDDKEREVLEEVAECRDEIERVKEEGKKRISSLTSKFPIPWKKFPERSTQMDLWKLKQAPEKPQPMVLSFQDIEQQQLAEQAIDDAIALQQHLHNLRAAPL